MNQRPCTLQSLVLASAIVALVACSDRTSEAQPATTPVSSSGTSAPTVSAQSKEGYELAAKGTGFAVGPVMAANTVYVFFDPACPHCAALWTNTQPLANKLKVVWMPVGLLQRASTPQGATILAAPNPAAAMAQNEASVQARQGGIPVNPSISDDMLAKVRANTELLTKLGGDSVPFILYKNGKTGQYGSRSGALDAEQLAGLVGL